MRGLAGPAAASLCLTLLVLACGSEYVGPTPVVDAGTRIAVMPFRVNGDLDERGAFRSGPGEPTISDILGEQVAWKLAAELAAIAVTTVDVETVLHATPPPGAAIYDVDLARRVGEEVGAHYVVLGAVNRFRQREGTSVGVEAPASVAYRALLVDVRRRSMEGTYRLDYTQQPLSDDITQLPRFLQGRFGWLTREEILDASLTQTARQIGRTIEQARAR